MPAYMIILYCVIFCHSAFAQKKWIGSSPGGWENMLNWQPVGVPAGTDDVILDNAFQENNYTISVPDIVVNIHSLVIAPATGKHIELVLPITNKNSPALVVNGNGDVLVIRQDGVFRNSSGLNSGQSIQLNGSICIYDEGAYIHNSRSAHANDIVAKLSTAMGTTRGIFEFDVPGGSYPISFSNRTYGTLILSATASGGTQTYNASGTNPVTINGNFQINSGVQFNADLTKDMVVKGDYIQMGGSFNVASQANNNIIKIRGNISQASPGIITETSGGLPVIELSGNEHQLVSAAGSITNSVTFSINNPSGISLANPLTLPFKLVLARGVLKTSGTNMITLLDSCLISGGSASSYIDGPLKKIGNSDFEFPIGKQGDYAPIKITRTAGSDVDEFVAEYFLANPQMIYGSNFENPPMVRISALEYWSLKRLAGSSSCRLTLSVGLYSHATALDKLVAARWDAVGSIWKSEGNDAYVGIATGTITTRLLSGVGSFTLGSTVAFQNPLPVKSFLFNALRNRDAIELTWNMKDSLEGDHFEIEQSYDGNKYSVLGKLGRKANISRYEWNCNDLHAVYFRIRIVEKNGDFYYSNVVTLPACKPGSETLRMSPVAVRDQAVVTITGKYDEIVRLVIFDMNGRQIKSLRLSLIVGRNEINLFLNDLRPGVYVIQIADTKGIIGSARFLKL